MAESKDSPNQEIHKSANFVNMLNIAKQKLTKIFDAVTTKNLLFVKCMAELRA